MSKPDKIVEEMKEHYKALGRPCSGTECPISLRFVPHALKLLEEKDNKIKELKNNRDYFIGNAHYLSNNLYRAIDEKAKWKTRAEELETIIALLNKDGLTDVVISSIYENTELKAEADVAVRMKRVSEGHVKSLEIEYEKLEKKLEEKDKEIERLCCDHHGMIVTREEPCSCRKNDD